MFVYFAMYLLIIASSNFIRRVKAIPERKENAEIIIMIAIVILVIGLRHPSMGIDLGYGREGGYLDSFDFISSMSFRSVLRVRNYLNYDRGYILFNKLISFVSSKDQWLLFSCALLSLVPVGYIIKKNSDDYLFSLLIYLGLPSFMILFSGLRQGIAIGICCYSYQMLKEKKYIWFFILVALAFAFHYSAPVFLLTFPLSRIVFSRKVRYALVLLLGLIYYFRLPLFVFFSRIFKESATADNNGAVTMLIALILIYLYCATFLNNDDQSTNGLLNILYFACVCQCFSSVYQTAIRIGYYFMFSVFLLVPNVVYDIRNTKIRYLSKYGIEAVFVIYGLYALFHAGASWAKSYPYHFYWN